MAADQTEKKGVTCACGHFEPFSSYVYAHWDLSLVYTCVECQAVYDLRAGHATPRRKSAPKTGKGKKK